MIYTCTLNTAIDMFVELQDFYPDIVNRSLYDEVQANGKGVNISIMLKKLNTNSIATGFIAGFSGKFIEDELLEMGINTDFVKVDGNTRINVFLKSNQGEYKIVNRGPEIQETQKELLLDKLKSINEKDTLFVSGSLPRGLDGDVLLDIAKISGEQKFNLVLDISHPVLKELMPYKPYLIKPNDDELQSLFPELDMAKTTDIVKAAKELISQGCQNVLVSVGARGAYFVNDEEVIHCTAPEGKVVNTACSGDAMLASFFEEYMQSNSSKKAIKKAVAIGSSTAFSTGLSDLKDINNLMGEVQVSNINVTN
ncbi:1-phosphofructokinase [Mammaliicoccus lentus]|uniref:1-phosphofructokinase n=1 Tax=Mammaliicoccus lentus TaxID=42858 RepID=UPI002B25C746|nr:1-phosphofructokinase [Mammaliicoccus lentus]WQK50247.1 1-phosphofructokinase [Mammaliicoccus lentus]